MEASDRNQILKLLADSRETFLSSAAGVSDEQSRLRPAPDQWSVLDCAEHVAIVENFLYNSLTTGLTPAPPPSDGSREQMILQRATDRSMKFTAPERAQPKGRFPSLAAALEKFQENRARTIDYIEHCDKDLRAYSLPHPILGPISAHEFLIVLTLHAARHAGQIREVRQSLGLS
jgi:hypothetical protein